MEKDNEHIQQELASMEKKVYIYMVLPFHIIASKKGKLFDEIEMDGINFLVNKIIFLTYQYQLK